MFVRHFKNLVIFVYSTLCVKTNEGKVFLPLIIDNKLVFVPLTKIKSSYIHVRRINDKLLEKTMPIMLSYTIGYDYEKLVEVVNKETLNEESIKIRDIVYENINKNI